MTTHQQKSRSFRLRLKSVVQNPKVSTDACYLWTLIDSFADPDGDNCYPSIKRLAKASKRSESWVKRHLQELKDAEMVTIHKKKTNGGWVNLYVLQVGRVGSPAT